MFLIAKLALLTCAFYLGIALIFELAFFLAAMRGGIFVTLNWRHWLPVFAVVWLISFALAWMVFMRPFIRSFPRPPLQ